MVKKYRFGNPFATEAVVKDVPVSEGKPLYGEVSVGEGFSYSYSMAEGDIVYGLGEANRGINKRGYCYVSNCTDDPNHTEDKCSLYGAHNFILVWGKETFGLFVDYPSDLAFDIGFTRSDLLTISCERADLDIYVIQGEDPADIVKQFRRLIGRSYIPPKFAFGFGQSRWGYKDREDFRRVAEGYRKNHLPIDMIYMDIDYMEEYKDFTVNEERFGGFKKFVREMKGQDIRLIPIIDAGVKIEEGYPVYEEGIREGYFCTKEDGTPFTAAVWPGYTHFPDVLNPKARAWFGAKYRFLTDMGIEGFWNDMNEPAIFYTPEGVAEVTALMEEFLRDRKEDRREDARWDAKLDQKVTVIKLREKLGELSGRREDYRLFYHQADGKRIRHDQVHNLFGCNMTRAAAEGLEGIDPDKRFLLFSRSSYIGMHRYGGIWTGDNKSWWSHILLNLKMLPSLNMCGFLYIGADLGGFGANASRDLVLRWLALGVFTPLMRNHAAIGTREQECYQFEGIEDFRHILGVRYRLIPYLYSEFMKAALEDELYFKPLAFDFPEDKMAAQVEDQVLLGNELMVAPVYTQNVSGRYVYLPERMKFVKFLPEGKISEEVLEKGHHYVEIRLNEVPLFIREGKCIPVVDAAECVADLDMETVKLIGFDGASYRMYDDDGVGRNYEEPGNWSVRSLG